MITTFYVFNKASLKLTPDSIMSSAVDFQLVKILHCLAIETAVDSISPVIMITFIPALFICNMVQAIPLRGGSCIETAPRNVILFNLESTSYINFSGVILAIFYCWICRLQQAIILLPSEPHFRRVLEQSYSIQGVKGTFPPLIMMESHIFHTISGAPFT